jgi:hypothetical protein
MCVTISCVHILSHFGGFRVRENFSRARSHPFGRVLRSRELLACSFSPFWTSFAFARTFRVLVLTLLASFAFARTSRVLVLTLLDEFCVRENFSRARSHPFGRVLRSRELLVFTFSPFWTSFAFTRTSRVNVPTILDSIRVRENYLATTNPPKKTIHPKSKAFGAL